MLNCVPGTVLRTFKILSHLIFYSNTVKARYYPHFTDRDFEAQLSIRYLAWGRSASERKT